MTREEIETRLLENILSVTSGMTIGKRAAARIVGGEKKLELLHVSGAVECQGKGSPATLQTYIVATKVKHLIFTRK